MSNCAKLVLRAGVRRWLRTGAFLGPALLYAVFFMVLPYLNLFQFSFWRVEDYVVTPDFTLDNYARVLETPLYAKVVLNSITTALFVTFSSLALGYVLAVYVCFFAGRYRHALYFMIVIPLWTSFLLRAFIWRIILGREGIVNSGLTYLGILDEPLTVLLFNRLAVCIALTYVFVPFVALPVYAALEKIPPSMIEASMDLGATLVQTFRRIVVPLSLPGVFAGVVFTFCLSFGDFVAPSLLGGPNGLMISSIIVSQFGSAFDWPFGSALAVIVAIIVAVGVTAASLIERRKYE